MGSVSHSSHIAYCQQVMVPLLVECHDVLSMLLTVVACCVVCYGAWLSQSAVSVCAARATFHGPRELCQSVQGQRHTKDASATMRESTAPPRTVLLLIPFSSIHCAVWCCFAVALSQGFFQALFLRTLSSGIYFPLFDLFQPVYVDLFDKYHSWRYPTMSSAAASDCTHPLMVHFLAGNSAGAVSGVVLNQLTAIKYASWDAEHGFLTTARRMWAEGGMRPFMKGIVPTVIRDTIFGGVFALTKEGCTRAIRKIQSRARKVSREEKEHPTASTGSSTTASLVKSVSAFTVHNNQVD